MREKCPHVVRTWPWVLLYLEMMCFPKERRRRMPSWLPGLSGICTRSRSPSGWSLHPSICLQSTAAHQLPPNLAEMLCPVPSGPGLLHGPIYSDAFHEERQKTHSSSGLCWTSLSFLPLISSNSPPLPTNLSNTLDECSLMCVDSYKTCMLVLYAFFKPYINGTGLQILFFLSLGSQHCIFKTTTLMCVHSVHSFWLDSIKWSKQNTMSSIVVIDKHVPPTPTSNAMMNIYVHVPLWA